MRQIWRQVTEAAWPGAAGGERRESGVLRCGGAWLRLDPSGSGGGLLSPAELGRSQATPYTVLASLPLSFCLPRFCKGAKLLGPSARVSCVHCASHRACS